MTLTPAHLTDGEGNYALYVLRQPLVEKNSPG
jgi:hypothetical protein